MPSKATAAATPATSARPRRWFDWRAPGTLILLAMIAGIAFGIAFGDAARAIQPVGQLFVRLLVSAAVPLVLANLLAGLTGLDDLGGLGRVGGRLLAYFVVTALLAMLLGLGITALLAPGAGIALPSAAMPGEVGKAPGLGDFLFGLVPENVFAALAEGQVIQLIVFALLIGAAAMMAPTDVRLAFHRGASVLDVVLRQLVALIMRFAPIGIAALSASAAAQFGAEMLGPLSLFVLGVWIAQAIFVVSILLLLALIVRQSPLTFLRATGPVYATAAATCSSLASLAVALRVCEERLRLPKQVYSLTLPIGSQLSKEGTAITLAAALLFTAQAAGVEFSWTDYGTILLVTILLSSASGGVPGGGLVKVLILVQAFHLPIEIAAVIGGVYRLIDISNTSVNMLADMVGTQIVASLESETEGQGVPR